MLTRFLRPVQETDDPHLKELAPAGYMADYTNKAILFFPFPL